MLVTYEDNQAKFFFHLMV